jgi:hypothetical protein
VELDFGVNKNFPLPSCFVSILATIISSFSSSFFVSSSSSSSSVFLVSSFLIFLLTTFFIIKFAVISAGSPILLYAWM